VSEKLYALLVGGLAMAAGAALVALSFGRTEEERCDLCQAQKATKKALEHKHKEVEA
jgi:hypothetical protein